MVSFAGNYKNPTEGWTVEENDEGKYYLAVPDYCECGQACCARPQVGSHPHTNRMTWDDEDEAHEYLDALAEKADEDYDNYLEENHDAIVQMERYEMFRNEY